MHRHALRVLVHLHPGPGDPLQPLDRAPVLPYDGADEPAGVHRQTEPASCDVLRVALVALVPVDVFVPVEELLVEPPLDGEPGHHPALALSGVLSLGLGREFVRRIRRGNRLAGDDGVKRRAQNLKRDLRPDLVADDGADEPDGVRATVRIRALDPNRHFLLRDEHLDVGDFAQHGHRLPLLADDPRHHHLIGDWDEILVRRGVALDDAAARPGLLVVAVGREFGSHVVHGGRGKPEPFGARPHLVELLRHPSRVLRRRGPLLGLRRFPPRFRVERLTLEEPAEVTAGVVRSSRRSVARTPAVERKASAGFPPKVDAVLRQQILDHVARALHVGDAADDDDGRPVALRAHLRSGGVLDLLHPRPARSHHESVVSAGVHQPLGARRVVIQLPGRSVRETPEPGADGTGRRSVARTAASGVAAGRPRATPIAAR
mmetsp:Transcript_3788/g.15347  ORF Transcript_3788/g.15347 Transcript_3788/m.15347 type:complete len:432 (-) Transcript_3788:29-1324(-)